MAKKITNFEESAMLNTNSYLYYYNRLKELALSMFEWENLPSTVNERYLELSLFNKGCAIYFKDEVLGDLCLNTTSQGSYDVYGDPIKRRAYSKYNNYQKDLDNTNSVIIWNNYLRVNSIDAIKFYARKLWNLDRTIDVNINAQKTPILLQVDEHQRMTAMNMYKEYDGNAPVIFGTKSLDQNAIKVLTTNAPFVSDDLYTLKTQIWNEALTYLGISNTNVTKKERLISDEVIRDQGGIIASRYSRLQMRRMAVDAINEMFGTDIKVSYRQDYREVDDELMLSGDSEDGDAVVMVTDTRTRTNVPTKEGDSDE